MELFYHEMKMRSVWGYIAVPFMVIFLGFGILMLIGALIGASIGREYWVFELCLSLAGAFVLFISLSFFYGFIMDDVRRFGIRDNNIWWDSPRWPNSSGSISLDNVSKVTILEGCKLVVTMRDGSVRRIPWPVMGEAVRTILSEHYSHVAVKFIMSS